MASFTAMMTLCRMWLVTGISAGKSGILQATPQLRLGTHLVGRLADKTGQGIEMAFLGFTAQTVSYNARTDHWSDG